MRKFFFSVVLVLFSTSLAPAQAGTPLWSFDPATVPTIVPFRSDSLFHGTVGVATSDSGFYTFTAPTTMYYRGMVMNMKSGGVGTLRFFSLATPLGTAIDSTVSTTQGIGTNTTFIGVKETNLVPARILLTAGQTYRLGGIYTSGAQWVGVGGFLVFTLY